MPPAVGSDGLPLRARYSFSAIYTASSLTVRYAISLAQAAGEWSGEVTVVWMSGQTMSGKMVLGRCWCDAGAELVQSWCRAGADNVGVGGAGGPSRVGKGKIGESDGGAKTSGQTWLSHEGQVPFVKVSLVKISFAKVPFGSHAGGSGVALWLMDGYDVFVIDIYSCDRP